MALDGGVLPVIDLSNASADTNRPLQRTVLPTADMDDRVQLDHDSNGRLRRNLSSVAINRPC